MQLYYGYIESLLQISKNIKIFPNTAFHPCNILADCYAHFAAGKKLWCEEHGIIVAAEKK